MLALLGRNKIGLIDGTAKKNMFGEELWGQWEKVNVIVLSWLMNSVSKSLLKRFNRVDGSRTYSLHKDIASVQQGTTSVSVYYTKFKSLWDEFEVLVPTPCCNCDKSKGFVASINIQKLYQFLIGQRFLIGLNESYQQARSQILMMDPLPTINYAYAIIVGDESQKVVVNSVSSMGMASSSLES
ncbi:hypothetical protein R3W88_012945 [Solanum pinnatisectum]|uniref:Retrotransposon gag domain-containing protein n=1 Tax=Solanum pinnatisectum TaxID=50273 RepID=A0AAV9LEA0_9SOLN|nr:hypothetical protein R3W88_012945 [Solanum pinnatisectum]